MESLSSCISTVSNLMIVIVGSGVLVTISATIAYKQYRIAEDLKHREDRILGDLRDVFTWCGSCHPKVGFVCEWVIARNKYGLRGYENVLSLRSSLESMDLKKSVTKPKKIKK
jgi:hypothetical protein